ncbi:MAG: cation-translocating P-type ATPase [Acetobacter sp.]|nr:cation-translocating P-type ATPase [Acetobacter sp.]
MIKEIMEFLSGVKMTVVSAVFLLTSLGFMIYNVEPIFNPAWLTVLISGTPIVFKAYNKLFLCRCISSPLLITIAMIAAIIIGELFAAGEVALIMAVGELLEDATIDKAKRGLGRLLELTPTTAHKIYADGKDRIVELKEVKKGDVLRILAGETVPADGVIISGTTSINQATLTGESLPVDKSVGDSVMAGTVNQFGVIEIKVENVKNTYLQKMINLVKEAESKKAPTQKIVDKWASILVPSALVIAILTYLFTGEIIRAVTVLVVFCPCALVLATPTSIMAAIGQAAKRGVLIKSGAALEEMGKVDTCVFDKTGTLTSGKIMVSDIISLSEKIKTEELLRLSASLEKYSEHTLGKAVVSKAEELQISLVDIQNFKMIAGKGVSGEINDKLLIAGNLSFIKQHHITLSEKTQQEIQTLSKQGKALVLIAFDGEFIGIIALTDTIREETAGTISLLNSLNVSTLLLTGDNQTSATQFAKFAGINQVYADLLPNDKVVKIEALQNDGHNVCMTGDGVNDAAALKIANVGVAMGSIGSDIAIDAADIALVNDNIESLPYLKKLSLLTIQTIKTNITISMTLNFLGIILSVTGILTPVTGAIVHNLGSVLVVLNAARLYDRKL